MSAASDYWRAVIRELAVMPLQMFPGLPLEQAAALKLAKAIDQAREKGAVEPPEQRRVE